MKSRMISCTAPGRSSGTRCVDRSTVAIWIRALARSTARHVESVSVSDSAPRTIKVGIDSPGIPSQRSPSFQIAVW